jgi:hypothetical protein
MIFFSFIKFVFVEKRMKFLFLLALISSLFFGFLLGTIDRRLFRVYDDFFCGPESVDVAVIFEGMETYI